MLIWICNIQIINVVPETEKYLVPREFYTIVLAITCRKHFSFVPVRLDVVPVAPPEWNSRLRINHESNVRLLKTNWNRS